MNEKRIIPMSVGGFSPDVVVMLAAEVGLPKEVLEMAERLLEVKAENGYFNKPVRLVTEETEEIRRMEVKVKEKILPYWRKWEARERDEAVRRLIDGGYKGG